MDNVQEQRGVRISPALFSWALVIAFVLFSLNLRGPVTAIPPLVGQIHATLGISLVEAGLITSIPIVCFGVLSPLAAWVIAKIGIHTSIIVMLVLTALGTLFRPYTGVVGMMGGTLMIGAALAMGNILGLLLIAHYFPRKRSLMTGVFTSAFNVGGMLFSALVVPIASLLGWQLSLAIWIWLPVITLIAWLLVISWQQPTGEEVQQHQASRQDTDGQSVLRNRTAWILSIAMSAHLFVYFSLTAWISAYMVDVTGITEQKAGLIAGIYQAASVIGALIFPYLERRLSLERLLVIIGILWFTIPVMMLMIPNYWAIWSIVGGANNAVAFVTILVLVIQHSNSMDENRHMSAMVQGIGFTVAAAGPVGLGYLHTASNGWSGPMIVIMASALVVSLAGVLACSDRRS